MAGDEEDTQKEIGSDCEHMPGFHDSPSKIDRMWIRWIFWRKIRRPTPVENAFYFEVSYFHGEGHRGIKRGYRLKSPTEDLAENEIAIAMHCDAGGILPNTGSRAEIGICVFLGKQITENTKNVEYHHGTEVSWLSIEIPWAPTSSYAWGGGAHALFYGFDMARMMEGLLE